MGDHDRTHDDRQAADCSTTDSFNDHGIGDGMDLVTRTYHRLPEPDRRAFAPSGAYFDRLESAFIWAYLGSVDEPGVESHVQTAIDDALARTREEFVDRPEADVRTEVLTAFYRRVAGFHCIYRD